MDDEDSLGLGQNDHCSTSVVDAVGRGGETHGTKDMKISHNGEREGPGSTALEHEDPNFEEGTGFSLKQYPINKSIDTGTDSRLSIDRLSLRRQTASHIARQEDFDDIEKHLDRVNDAYSEPAHWSQNGLVIADPFIPTKVRPRSAFHGPMCPN